MKWFWLAAGWWLLFIIITAFSAKAGVWDNPKIFSDDVWCDNGGCFEVDPYILVEKGFGQEIGTAFRTESGCLLSLGISLRQGSEAYCFEDKKSAERFFPALKIVQGLRD